MSREDFRHTHDDRFKEILKPSQDVRALLAELGRRAEAASPSGHPASAVVLRVVYAVRGDPDLGEDSAVDDAMGYARKKAWQKGRKKRKAGGEVARLYTRSAVCCQQADRFQRVPTVGSPIAGSPRTTAAELSHETAGAVDPQIVVAFVHHERVPRVTQFLARLDGCRAAGCAPDAIDRRYERQRLNGRCFEK